jgi:hypothetical protein
MRRGRCCIPYARIAHCARASVSVDPEQRAGDAGFGAACDAYENMGAGCAIAAEAAAVAKNATTIIRARLRIVSTWGLYRRLTRRP